MASKNKSKNKFVLSKSDDETLTVFLNGEEIASAKELVTKIAEVLKIPVERGTYDSEDNRFTPDE